MEKKSMFRLWELKRRLDEFRSLEWVYKKMFIEAFIMEGIARMVMLFVPFKIYKKCLGVHKEETIFEIEMNEFMTVKRVAWAVVTASKHTPWQSKCLVQAMTAQKMLERRKVASTIYFGVKKEQDGMSAHSWLRCGPVFVTGGGNKDQFLEVSKFSKFILRPPAKTSDHKEV